MPPDDRAFEFQQQLPVPGPICGVGIDSSGATTFRRTGAAAVVALRSRPTLVLYHQHVRCTPQFAGQFFQQEHRNKRCSDATIRASFSRRTAGSP